MLLIIGIVKFTRIMNEADEVLINKLDQTLNKKFNNLWHLVGNTPMLELQYTFNGNASSVFVKCEHYNLTGSVKDRMALYILFQAYLEDKIRPGDTIVEATSGSSGISLAAIGKSLGHPVKIIMPKWVSQERIDIVKSLGAEVVLISKEQGGFLRCIELAECMSREQVDVFLPRQFENRYNAEAHEKTTAVEIWEQLQSVGKTPDAMIAGVGTGGTIMGVGKYLRSKNAMIMVHPLEPEESPTLTAGRKIGSHRIQGLSDEFIPAITQLNELDDIVQAGDGDAIIIAQKLANQLGLAVGISSGANVIGAIKIKELMGESATVVTMLCDDNKKYLSTDLMKEEPVKKGYISSSTNFTGYQPISRLKESIIN